MVQTFETASPILGQVSDHEPEIARLGELVDMNQLVYHESSEAVCPGVEDFWVGEHQAKQCHSPNTRSPQHPNEPGSRPDVDLRRIDIELCRERLDIDTG